MEDRWIYPEESQGGVVHLARGSESVARVVFFSSSKLQALLFIKAMSLDLSEFYEAVEGISGLRAEHKAILLAERGQWVTVEENEDFETNLSLYALGRIRQDAESFALDMCNAFPGEVVKTIGKKDDGGTDFH